VASNLKKLSDQLNNKMQEATRIIGISFAREHMMLKAQWNGYVINLGQFNNSKKGILLKQAVDMINHKAYNTEKIW
jgi:hypothetical protein